jgi:hypothetical protein
MQSVNKLPSQFVEGYPNPETQQPTQKEVKHTLEESSTLHQRNLQSYLAAPMKML